MLFRFILVFAGISSSFLLVTEWYFIVGFPGDARGKEPACQCRRHKRRGFDPWVGKIPWRRAWQCTSVFLLENPIDGEPGGLQSMGSPRVRHDGETEHTRMHGCAWVLGTEKSKDKTDLLTLFRA